MFIQSEKFVEKHQGKIGDISVYGQEFNPTTWQLCKMNLAIRGIDGNIGTHNADTFQNDLHKGLRADYILANPPFNISDWSRKAIRGFSVEVWYTTKKQCKLCLDSTYGV